MADTSVFTFCSLLISNEHSQSSSKQVLKTSPCVYLNKTVYRQQLNPNDICFPSRPVTMGKLLTQEQKDDGYGKTGVGHMITASQNKP